MKILRLDLLAFGPFTRQCLSLADGEEGLHIVYGPNEAGKTSTLRALRCLLYGFPTRTDDDFLHSYKDLRVGALLRGPEGSPLECIRRKGNKNTLRAADDAAILDERALSQFLAGVNDDGFCRQFGIDHAQLVAGGREIVAGGGEIGQILFAAASGFAQLNEVRRKLVEEAEALFSPAASVRPINRIINDLKEKRKAARDAQLSSSVWKSHEAALDAAQQRKQSLEAIQLQLNTEKGRLQRLHRALPDIARRAQVLKELADLRDVPDLAPDFADRRRAADKQWNVAHLREHEAVQLMDELNEQLAGVDVFEAVLSRKENIERLTSSLAIHLKAEDDLRTLLAPQRDQLLRDAADLLRDLGRDDVDVSSAAELRLTREERHRVQRLGSDYAGLIERVELAHRRAAELHSAVAESDRQLQQLPPQRDPAPLRRALAQLHKQGDLSARLATLKTERQRAAAQAQVDLRKLPLWQGSLEDLEALAVPCTETIAEFEHRAEEAKNDCAKLGEQLTYARQQRDDLNEKLQQLELQQEVPTEADLNEARALREEGWRLVRGALREEKKPRDAAKFLDRFPEAETLETAYEQSVRQADDLADRLRREAERVGEKSQLMAQRDKQDKRREELEEQLQNAQRRLDQCQRDWAQQWRSTGLEPLTPREMRGWAAKQSALVERAETIRRFAEDAASLQAQIDHHFHSLQTCLAGLGVAAPASDATLDDLAALCEETLEQVEATEARREQLQRDADRSSRELKAALEDQRVSHEALQSWRGHWTEATRRLGLQDDAEPTVANEVLDTLDELFKKIHEAENLTQRIEGITREAEHFAQNVKTVCEGAAPELAAWPYARATMELQQRLEITKKAASRREDLQKQLANAQKRCAAAQDQLRSAEVDLKALCREAKCKSPEELPAIESRALRQRDLRRSLEEIETRLHQEALGKPLEKFIEEALAEDSDELPAAIARLEQQRDEAAQELSQVNQTIGQERNELAKMDGSADAARAQEEAEQLLAQLRDDAERYVRVRLAAEVLQGAIQRHREKNQGPVLKRASELFCELTLGSFAALKVDYNEAGEALLVGVRPSGQHVEMKGMSDGSCDQLYLALRLASLEHYLESHPPLPFIVDDILITFDDDRAAAALVALERLSQRTQVIFFTHHRRLVELAKKHLPKRMVHIHQLPNPLAPAESATEPRQDDARERTLFA
jgi:uncharacterized protein YhaN